MTRLHFRCVLQLRVAGMPLSAVQDELRKSLVHALRWGHTLVIRMANTAAVCNTTLSATPIRTPAAHLAAHPVQDFAHAYCADDSFPLALFNAAALPRGAVLPSAEQPSFSKVRLSYILHLTPYILHLASSCEPRFYTVRPFSLAGVFHTSHPILLSCCSPGVLLAAFLAYTVLGARAYAQVLRPSDTQGPSGGQMAVPQSFRVVVTSTFKPESYEELLRDSLPLERLQVMIILPMIRILTFLTCNDSCCASRSCLSSCEPYLPTDPRLIKGLSLEPLAVIGYSLFTSSREAVLASPQRVRRRCSKDRRPRVNSQEIAPHLCCKMPQKIVARCWARGRRLVVSHLSPATRRTTPARYKLDHELDTQTKAGARTPSGRGEGSVVDVVHT